MNFLAVLTPEQIAAITPDAMKVLMGLPVETPEMKLRNIIDKLNHRMDAEVSICCLSAANCTTCNRAEATKIRDLVEEFVNIALNTKEELWIRYEPLQSGVYKHFKAAITLYSRKEMESMFEHPEKLIGIPKSFKNNLSSYYCLGANDDKTKSTGVSQSYAHDGNVLSYQSPRIFSGTTGTNFAPTPAYWFLRQIYKIPSVRIIDPIKYSVIVEYIK